MRRLLPALLAGMLLLTGCSSSEADAASVTSAETSYAGASEAEQETQDVTLAETVGASKNLRTLTRLLPSWT